MNIAREQGVGNPEVERDLQMKEAQEHGIVDRF
jgi:hypothetical protein